jgi:hypothetical protein
MFKWFKKKKSPEECVSEIVNRYFDSPSTMGDNDYTQLKKCLEEWGDEDSPEFLGAMAYVRYREGQTNKMWDYIEKDLELELGEEEHGAFIPAMMADVDAKTKYEILKKIHTRIGGTLSLEIMARIARDIGKEMEVLEIAKEYEMKNPKNSKVRRIIEELGV